MHHDRVPASLFYERALGLFLVISLCLIPAIAALAPRFLAFMPGIITISGLFLYRAAFKSWPLFSKPIFFWFLSFTVLCGLSALWGLDSAMIAKRTLGIGVLLLSGVGLLALGAYIPQEKLFRFFPLSFTGAATLCLLDLYSNGGIYALFHDLQGEEFNPSQLNRGIIALTLMSFPVFFMLWPRGPVAKPPFILMGLVALLMAGILYKTDSQSAQLGFATGLLFFLFFPFKRRIFWLGLAVALALLVLLAPLLSQWMFSSLAAHAGENAWLARGYAPDRMEIWDFISRKALESPVYGFGLEATRQIEHFDTKNLYTPLDHVLHPHNAVLQIWIEFGAIGALMASAFIVFLLRRLYRLNPESRKLALCVFMATIAAAVVSYGLWQGWWLGLFMVLTLFCRVFAIEINKGLAQKLISGKIVQSQKDLKDF